MNYVDLCYAKIRDLPLELIKPQEIEKIVAQFKSVEPAVITQQAVPDIEKQFYEEMTSVAFVPSPDLMNSYQSSFSKTICGEPVNTPNLKLKSIFSSAIPKKNLNEDKRAINFNIDKGTFDYVGNALEGKCIQVENREQSMLENLRKLNIESTLPVMENTIQRHELKSLQSKSVKISNLMSLSDWKQRRAKLQSGRSD